MTGQMLPTLQERPNQFFLFGPAISMPAASVRSFSGKSTLARKIIERLRCAYISLDDINAERGLWGGDGIPLEEWERTHALAREGLATWMGTGKDARYQARSSSLGIHPGIPASPSENLRPSQDSMVRCVIMAI